MTVRARTSNSASGRRRASRSRTRTPVTSRACAHEADGAGAGHHGRAEAGRGAGQRRPPAGRRRPGRRSSGSRRRSCRRAGSGRAAGRPSRVRCRCSGMPRPAPKTPANDVVRRHAERRSSRAGRPGGQRRAAGAAGSGTRIGTGRTRCGASRVASRPRSVQRLVHQVRTRAAPGSAGRRGSACWTGWTCRRRGRGPRPGRPLSPREAASSGGAGAGDTATDDEHVEVLARAGGAGRRRGAPGRAGRPSNRDTAGSRTRPR